MSTMSGDAAEQVVRIGIQGSEAAIKISGAGAKQLAILIYTVLKEQEKTSGKTRLKALLKSGKELTVFEVKESDLKMFAAESKRYGVLYCALREKGGNPYGVIDVIVRAEDAAKINRIVEKLQYAVVDTSKVKAEIERGRDINKNNEIDINKGKEEIQVLSEEEENLFIDELFENSEPTMTEGDTLPMPISEIEEIPVLSEEKEDLFIDELFGNPEVAMTEKGPRSSPISELDGINQGTSQKETSKNNDVSSRKSVKKEIEKIRRRRDVISTQDKDSINKLTSEQVSINTSSKPIKSKER